MTTSPLMPIGRVAELAGVPSTTLRFYEQQGLIDPPVRVSGQRRYDASVLARLMVIRFCRIAGLSLDDIATVIADTTPGRSTTKEIAARQVVELDAEIEQLVLARRMMQSATECTCPAIERCDCGAMRDVLAELRQRLGPAAP